MANLLSIFALVCAFFAHTSSFPLLGGAGPVITDLDCNSSSCDLTAVCESNSCIPVLKCLQDRNGTNFCMGLLGTPALPSSTSVTENQAASCITVSPWNIS